MIKNKKYPKIVPSFLRDENGKKGAIYLQYNVYESIFDGIEDLKKRILKMKQKKAKKKAAAEKS
jgi:hypothetical protein